MSARAADVLARCPVDDCAWEARYRGGDHQRCVSVASKALDRHITVTHPGWPEPGWAVQGLSIDAVEKLLRAALRGVLEDEEDPWWGADRKYHTEARDNAWRILNGLDAVDDLRHRGVGEPDESGDGAQ